MAEGFPAAREAADRLRAPAQEADRRAQRLETEVRTLEKMLASGGGERWPRAIDRLSAERGYEAALGAALGDDLDASIDPAAPAHWAETGAGEGDPALPAGARALSEVVAAPAALARRREVLRRFAEQIQARAPLDDRTALALVGAIHELVLALLEADRGGELPDLDRDVASMVSAMLSR